MESNNFLGGIFPIIHCTALHCPALHCTAPHWIALHSNALRCTALHFNALNFNALHYTVQKILLECNKKRNKKCQKGGFIVLVLLSTHIERVSVSCMRDFCLSVHNFFSLMFSLFHSVYCTAQLLLKVITNTNTSTNLCLLWFVRTPYIFCPPRLCLGHKVQKVFGTAAHELNEPRRLIQFFAYKCFKKKGKVLVCVQQISPWACLEDFLFGIILYKSLMSEVGDIIIRLKWTNRSKRCLKDVFFDLLSISWSFCPHKFCLGHKLLQTFWHCRHVDCVHIKPSEKFLYTENTKSLEVCK